MNGIEIGDTVRAEVETVLGNTEVSEFEVDAVDDDGVYSHEPNVLGKRIRFVPWEAFEEQIWESV